MEISNISDFAAIATPEGQTGKAESDARKLAVWIERISRFAPEIGVKRSEALQCPATRTKIELDAALAVLLEQGRVTLVIDRRAHRIIPTAAILADGWGRKLTRKGATMRTIEAETISPATVITRDEAAPVARSGNYEPVRFNAMKHGILSRLAVLAHEDHAEFADLLAALMDEHRPAGMTERHLIEELATIIWRKRRVLLAEGAKINEGLKSAVSSAASVIQAAAPFQRDIGGENADLREFMEGTPEEIAERQRDAALDLAATQKAAAILRKGGPNAYAQARLALMQESRDWWDGHVEEESYPATAEGLAGFIRHSLEPICTRMVKEAQITPAIKAQTLGEGLRAHLLEKLNRYETHLDRKFERTLAMLLKLKDLRGA